MGNGLGGINSDEFDTIFDLIVTVLFMAFGVFAIAAMSRNLADRLEISKESNKIEVSASQHLAEDPYYMTGYQAYMVAWHMDDLSYESITYIQNISGNPSSTDNPVDNPEIPDGKPGSDVYIDGATADYAVTLSVLDEEGEIRGQFIPWRNQMITGRGVGEDKCVNNIINESLYQVSDDDIVSMWRGVPYKTGSPQIKWHLEFTGRHRKFNNLGNDPNTGGKNYLWVIRPLNYL